MEKYNSMRNQAIEALKQDLTEQLNENDSDLGMLANDYIVSGNIDWRGILLYDMRDFDMFVKDQFEWTATELLRRIGSDFDRDDKWFYFDESGEKIHSIWDGAKWYRERLNVEELVGYVVKSIRDHIDKGYGLDFDFGYSAEFTEITDLLLKWFS